jgi:hypothetical protein
MVAVSAEPWISVASPSWEHSPSNGSRTSPTPE